MSRPGLSRREFLHRAGRAGLAAGLGSQLGPLAGCGDAVDEPTGRYDAIVVGGGTAGAIVATKLQLAGRGRKRILVIEAGGLTSAEIGGTDRPPWLPAGRADLTLFDVPGQYSTIAFQPLGAPYQLGETSFTYQGIGVGGNSMFNGMLFQTNPPAVFDERWPATWRWGDVEPYFERVRGRIPVTSTPSTDGAAQNAGAAAIVHALYAANGWVEADTSRPFSAPGVYSRPYVAAEDGRRAGPISGWLRAVAPGGVPDPGLDLLLYAKAERIVFAADGAATAVEYAKREALDQSLPGARGRAELRAGGLLVLAAGALATPRLLLLSGVGPRGREAEMLAAPAPFAIDNPGVGVGVFDHVITLVAWDYDGPVDYRAYDYGDYAANRADLERYLARGEGPYAQYQPVSILNYASRPGTPDVEVFVNPNGVGAPGGRYYGPRAIATYVMLLDPRARGTIRLDEHGKVRAPEIYLPETDAGEADTTLMAQAVLDLIALLRRDPALTISFGPGGASHPHLDPTRLDDVRAYVTGPSPVDGVYYSRLLGNHFGGTVALGSGPGGTDPATLLVRGTSNVAVVDASLIPSVVPAHPVGTIMAVADRAGDVLAARWS
ncbi:MAG: GMC family oxidoreductase [Thermodesulfobacteriota bacterium]